MFEEGDNGALTSPSGTGCQFIGHAAAFFSVRLWEPRTMIVLPYDAVAIEHHLGPAARDRARDKRRGGDSASKGYRFEIAVGLRLLLRYTAYYVEQPTAFPSVWFWEQPMGFVDDLLIHDKSRYRFYQIKTGTNIQWRKNHAGLRRDFRRQNALMSSLGLPATTILVVDSVTERDSLRNQQKGTQHPVLFLPPDPLPQRSWQDTYIRGHIGKLMGGGEVAEAIIEPSLVYNVCRAFKSAWDGRSGRGLLSDFVRDASEATFGLLRETPYRGYDELIARVATDFETRMGLIGRCLVVESDFGGDAAILPFERLEDVGTFLMLLRDAPDPKTVEDIFGLWDWWNGEASD